MSATSRLKQVLFMVAALALVSLGLVAALSTASPARADDTTAGGEPCVETDDSYTDWVDQGEVTQTVANTPPGADTDTVRYLPAGTVQVGNGDAVEATPDHYENLAWFIWTGGPRDEAPDPEDTGWHGPQPNVPNGAPHTETPGVYSTSGEQGRGSWFKLDGDFVPGTPGQEETFHTEYRWQKQVRTFVEGVDCPDPGPDCEQDPTAEGCPPIEEKPWVCHPVEGNGELGNGWNLIAPAQASSHIDEALFPDGVYWKHETSDGRHDIYSEDGQTCPDAEEPEKCPEDTDHAGEEIPEGETEESFCDDEVDPGPDTCPEDTDKAGQEIPEGETEEEFCDEDEVDVCPEDTDKAGEEIPGDKTEEEFCDEDDEEDVCPEDSDHAGEEVPEGGIEECDDDDVDPGPDCTEDPTQKKCDEDNPPVVVPDDGNSPSNGPTVRGASATAPTAAAGTTVVAGTPAARVPTAVNAGLAPEELAGNGGGLGLLGIAAALLGAALVGLTFRPKRRIGAALRART